MVTLAAVMSGGGAASLSLMVNTAKLGPPNTAPPAGLLNARLTVSSPSYMPSSKMLTVMVLLVSPFPKLKVTAVAV